MLIFLVLLIPLSALAYALWHVWILLPLPTVWRTVVVVLCVMAFLMLFLAMSRGLDRLPMPVAAAMYKIGTSSMIVMLYSTLMFLLLDILRLFHLIPRSALRDNAYMAIAIVAALVLLLVCGNIHYHHKVRQTVTLTTTKALKKDVKIVLISDLHIGYHIRRGELRQWVEMINSERPDIVLIAGDIVDRSMRPVIEDNMAEEFHNIKAPIYACFGNHEYFCDEHKCEAFYKEAGITLLRDSVVVCDGVTIVGRDDRMNPHRKGLSELLEGVDHDNYIILLDHQPFNLEQSAQAGVGFQFSGHTHHGQVFPMSLATDAFYTIAHGQYSIDNTRYYISSGLGIWGGKYRIGTDSEYVVATLSNK